MNSRLYEKILIAGFGNIGRHIRKEFEGIPVAVYDPNVRLENETQVSTLERNYGIAFICVPTEPREDGACDISIVEESVARINAEVIVIKSTVPPRTTEYLAAKYRKNLVFSPETYGTTQHCAESPNFVILGGNRREIGRAHV